VKNLSEKKHSADFEKCIEAVMKTGKDKGSAFAICTAQFERAGKSIWEGMKEAEWDTAYINDLPDNAFAYIEPGGEKDETGRTTPRSLRHLPYKNANGEIDLPHLRNALARLPQTQISAEAKAEAKKKLCAAAKEAGIESEVCGLAESLMPVKLHLFSESIKLDGHKVSGVAIHPKRLWHPEEGEAHLFLKEELKKAAPTLAGKPFGIDHLRILPKPNVVEKAWYDEQENGVAFEGTVDDNVAQQIREGKFKGLSIELNWFKDGVMLEKIGGALTPRNFDFTSVHFMHQFPPADKDTYVKLWEGVVLPMVPPPFDVQIEQLRQMFEERLRYLEGQINALTRSDPWQQASAPAIIIFKEAEQKIAAEVAQLKNMLAELTKLKEAYITEKTKREQELAEKEKQLATKESEFDIALRKINERLNTHGVNESEIIVSLRKKLNEAEAKMADLEKQMREGIKEWQNKYFTLHKGITESIPPPHIWKCWTFGPKQMIAQQMRILGIAPNDRW
jgi:DNA-binding transcriptional MerR regulator